jgi:hypothetical protein
LIVARIQSHPARDHLLPRLLEDLAPLETEVVVHSSDPPSPWAGYQCCLSHLPSYADHLLVVQDDVELCHNFAPALLRIAESNPDVPVCLFLARLPKEASVRATRALQKNLRYVTLATRSFVPVVAILWPVAKAEEFMLWVEQNPHVRGRFPQRSDDAMVGIWTILTKQEIRATVPSLVEHPDMEPSLIGRHPAWGKDKGRVALHLVQGDALDYDW